MKTLIIKRFVAPALLALLSTLNPRLSAAQAAPGDLDTSGKGNPANAPAQLPGASLSFSANPTTEELFRARVFEEPLVPVGGQPTASDNADLAAALIGYSKRTGPDDFTSVTGFLASNPDSPWRAALLTDLGLEYYNTAHYSLALDAWSRAWELARNATDLKGKAIADRAVAQLAGLYARLGRTAKLEALLKSVQNRVFIGPATEDISAAREGLWTMQNRPEIAFRCGPLALHRIELATHSKNPAAEVIFNFPSTRNGTSLSQVAGLSKKIGLNYQMAYRTDGDFIVPSVVHWKVGHYAALVRQEGDQYLLEDPTFGNTVWATRKALEEETSGYFLIPPGPLPRGWRSVKVKEGDTVWGKGVPPGHNKGQDGCHDKKSGGTDCNKPKCKSSAMAVSRVHLMLVSLNIMDTPVGYQPPVGPSADFTVTYNQREAYQPANFTYSNFGPKWTCDWISYITDNPQSPAADVSYYAMGGGTRTFTGFDTNTQSFTYQRYDQTLLTRTGPASYEMVFPDGSKHIFDQSDGSTGTSRKIFLTELVDPSGNSVTINYDGNFRITALTDAIGQMTTLSYSNAADIYKVTRVTDPFHRFASFDYDSLGRLTNITDVIGMSSQFTYEGSGDFINSLITPYGTTSFTSGETNTTRWLETLYPDGSRERVEFNQSTNLGIAASVPISELPQGMNIYNNYLYGRNTFYWSRNACATAYGDYTKARLYHWLHEPDVTVCSGVLDSMKEPLEGRVWFNYEGQTSPYFTVGDNNRPSRIGRVLDDGSTQLYTYAYDGFGHVTNSIDPVGRTLSYIYDTSGIDLLEVRMTRGGKNELLSKRTYNAQHQPLTITDAAGQTTTNTYNARGQLLTTTNPKGETTTYAYDTNGYLVAVDGALPGTNDTRTAVYDGYGRIMTVTDVDGYSVRIEYDALDRITKIHLPDSTTYEVAYDRLEPAVLKDRAGRLTVLEYNALGHLTKRTDPLGRVTRFQWCNCGAIKSLTDPMGRTTSWDKDVQGRLIRKQYGDGSQVNYEYEHTTSRLRQVTDEKQQITTSSYNRDNTLRLVTYANTAAPTPPISYTYDPDYRRVISMTDGTGTTTYGYFPVTGSPTLGAGQLASVDGPLANDTITYGYDELGRRVSTAINGVASTLTYDAIGRVAARTNALGEFGYTYDGASTRILTESFPNGQTVSRSYGDNAQDHALQSISNRVGATLVSDFIYGRDVPAHRITSWLQQAGTAAPDLHTFAYDDADRLLADVVTNSGARVGAFAYAYDPADNRLSEVADGVTNVGSYNALNQLSTSTASGFSRTNEWDAEDRLVAITLGNDRVEFTYNGDGCLASLRHLTNGIEASYSRFVWCDGRICEQRDGANTVTKRYFDQGMQLETGPNAGSYYYTRDHLGSIRELTDSSGTVRARYSYDPSGRRTKVAGDLDTDFGFAGMFWSGEAGLSLTRWRAYDPQLGRWLSRDPLNNAEMVEGPNLYAYVADNPVNLTDPYGLDRGNDLAQNAWWNCAAAVAKWYQKWLEAKRVCNAAQAEEIKICSKAESGSAKSFFSKCQSALRNANKKCKPLSDATEDAWKQLTDCGGRECRGLKCYYDFLNFPDEVTGGFPFYPIIAYAAGHDPKTGKFKCIIKAY